MKRSEINRLEREAVAFLSEMKFALPPFAYFSPEKWATLGHDWDEIRDNMLGWDITDFGSGDFEKIGLLLFTMRNGNLGNPAYPKPYAEKLLLVGEEQITPFHFHSYKMEDIINRGGGTLLITVYNSTPDGAFADTPVPLAIDGHRYTVGAGETIRLTPGESISISQGMYHRFMGERGTGRILLGEVSRVNDDKTDNRFYEPTGRFPDIEEDEKPLYLLCGEYPRAE